MTEALDEAGNAAELPIRNEETGKEERVSVFAVRVPEATNRVAADKQDNGIIEDDQIGSKRAAAVAAVPHARHRWLHHPMVMGKERHERPERRDCRCRNRYRGVAQLAARGDQCRELIKEQEALHGRVRDDFNALARLQAEAANDAPPMLARDLLQQSGADLQRRDRKAAVLDDELQALLDIEQSLQQRSQEAVAARDAARTLAGPAGPGGHHAGSGTTGRCRTTCSWPWRVPTRSSAWLPLPNRSMTPRPAPIRPTRSSYLHRRSYGSTAYRGWPLVRTVDGWLAELCGFDRARREYATLVELPPHLQEHARRARDDVEAARQPVQQARDALARAGGDPLRQQLQTAQGAVAQALLVEQLHRQTVDAKQAQIDGFRSWTDAEGSALLTALRARCRPRAWTTCTGAWPPRLRRGRCRARAHPSQSPAPGRDRWDGRRAHPRNGRAEKRLDSLQAARRSYQAAADIERQAYEAPSCRRAGHRRRILLQHHQQPKHHPLLWRPVRPAFGRFQQFRLGFELQFELQLQLQLQFQRQQLPQRRWYQRRR